MMNPLYLDKAGSLEAMKKGKNAGVAEACLSDGMVIASDLSGYRMRCE